MRHLHADPEFARRKERLAASARGRVLELDERTLLSAEGAYDTIVVVNLLCGADDVDATFRRVDELLAPGGRLLVLEHVRGRGLRARMQDAVTPLWRRTPLGCHANRDVIGDLRRNGFAVTDCDRFTLGRSLPIVAPHVAAVAIRKAVPPMEETSG